MLELKISDTLEFRREEGGGGGGGGERVHDRSLNRVIAHVCANITVLIRLLNVN